MQDGSQTHICASLDVSKGLAFLYWDGGHGYPVTPICCDVQMVFSLHSCELQHDSHHFGLLGKLSGVATLGSFPVGMKTEWHAHYADFVGGSATPLCSTEGGTTSSS